MAVERRVIDVDDMPEVARLVDDLDGSRTARVLLRRGREAAIITPLESRPPDRRRKPVSRLAKGKGLEAAFGGWAGLIDVDTFLEEVYADRELGNLPPVEL